MFPTFLNPSQDLLGLSLSKEADNLNSEDRKKKKILRTVLGKVSLNSSPSDIDTLLCINLYFQSWSLY